MVRCQEPGARSRELEAGSQNIRIGRYTLCLLGLLLGVSACREHVVDIYHIPSGSMRPTLVEDDYVVVRKHVAPEEMERAALVVFQREGQRCIKRLIGKPGDLIYFYGGSIYGLDKAGEELLCFSALTEDYVPFVSFEGTLEPEQDEQGKVVAVCFKQMGLPLGRLSFRGGREMKAALLHGSVYGDFLGMNNFALARIITDKEVGRGQAVYYLELRHSPSLSSPPPRFVACKEGNMRLEIGTANTILPLHAAQVDVLGGVSYFNAVTRYAYFRQGTLRVAGVDLFPTASLHDQDFLDRGVPNKEMIQTHGIRVPEGHYLVLGDNGPLSSDSRDFGCIPQEAIQGVAISVIQ